MAKEKTKNSTQAKKVETNSTKTSSKSKVATPVKETKSPSPKTKKAKLTTAQKVFYTIVAVLTVYTAVVGYQALDFFILQPLSQSGQPVYGYRLEGLPDISETVIEDVNRFGTEQEGVESTSVTVSGQVLYISVRVANETPLEEARTTTALIADQLKSVVPVSEELHLYDKYDLQLVVYNDDPDVLKEQNREAELEYITLFSNELVEEILVHAETYPTAATIARAKANIDLMNEGEIKSSFNARLDAIVEWTADEIEAAGVIPELIVNQDLPQSDLASYPSWGAYDSQTDSYIWR